MVVIACVTVLQQTGNVFSSTHSARMASPDTIILLSVDYHAAVGEEGQPPCPPAYAPAVERIPPSMPLIRKINIVKQTPTETHGRECTGSGHITQQTYILVSLSDLVSSC